MSSQQMLWNEAELSSIEEWRQPSPAAVLAPELMGAGMDASRMPVDGLLGHAPWAAKRDETGRPVSPGTVETAASMLRSLSFAASRPRTSGDSASRLAQYSAAAESLKEQLRKQPCERMRQVAPALTERFEAAVLAGCGVLLGAEHPDGGFEWATWHIEQLRKLLPHQEAAFPGAYYREIFSSDVSQLGTLLADVQRTLAKRRAAAADTIDAIARSEGSSAARLESAASAAEGVGCDDEGRAARAVARLVTRATTLDARAHDVEAEVKDLKSKLAEAERAKKRAADKERQLEARLAEVEDERNALRLKLTVEAETRRRVEAASVKTLEQLKVQEEARWAAERLLQQEGAKLAEAQLLHRKEQEEAQSQVEEAERREDRASAEAQAASNQRLEAERQKVALEARVASLEGLKARLEEQLRLEREVGQQELSLRQQAEQSLQAETRAHAEARQAQQASDAKARDASDELGRAQSELQSTEAQLSVANEQGLQLHVETASTEKQLSKVKELRTDDQGKILQLNADKAALVQRGGDLEARLRQQAQLAEKQAHEEERRRYELQAQLTEANRKLEAAQADAVRSEVYLQRERQSGTHATDEGSRLQSQLDDERRTRQTLAQQLAAEQALRQQALTGQQALQRELASKAREGDVAVQRLHQLQAELQLARTESHETREVAELRQAVQRERERISGIPAGRGPGGPSQGSVHVSLMPQTSVGGPGGPRGGGGGSGGPGGPRGGLGAYGLDPSDLDELNRSDLWNFSAGQMGRQQKGAGGADPSNPNTVLPRITSPFHVGPGY